MSGSRGASRLGGILPGVLDGLGLGGALASAAVVDAWPRVVGDKLARHVQAVSLIDGVLLVEAESSLWMQELGYHKILVLRRLAEECGPGKVRDLKLVLRKSP